MRRYCLYCFDDLPDIVNRCGSCRKSTHPADYRSLWNKNPGILGVERTIKGAIVVAVAVSILLFFFCVGPVSTGRGAGFFFLMPVVASHGVWKTASALTRAQPYFQPRVFWLAAFVLAGIVLAFVHWFLLTLPAIGIVGVVLATRDFHRWKSGLITGMARV